MSGIEDKLSSFSSFVLNEAHKKRDDLLAECELKRKQIKEKKELEYLTNAYAEIQNAVSRYAKENNENVLKVEMALKKELILKREHIIDEVFAEAINKINDYVKTPEYEAWLLDKVKKAADEVGSGKKTIYVSKDDMRFKDKIESQFEDTDVEAADNESSLIGGVRVYNTDKRIFADYSIDQMLDDERHSFLQTSGLNVG